MKYNIEDLVEQVLERNVKARGDDFILYGAVLRNMGVDIKRSLADIFAHHVELGLPAMESVSRARRKLTELRPELADAKVKEIRQQEQMSYYLKYRR